MKKLSLDVDEIRVESFAPAEDEAGRRGTVRGRAQSEMETRGEYTCSPCYTYDYSCIEYGPTCWDRTCDWGYDCPESFGVTCPDFCRTEGVIC